MSVEVDTNQMPGIAGQQSMNGETVASVIGMSIAAASPQPVAIDPVSRLVAKAFAAYAKPYFAVTADGVDKHLDGAQAVLKSSITYGLADVSPSAEVAARGILRAV